MAAESPLIVCLGGSMREKSRTWATLREVEAIVQAKGAQVEMLNVRELALPMFIPDIGVEDYPTAHQPAIGRLLEAYRRADAMVWGSPTYHGSVSGAVKNAIDFAELLADDEPPYLAGCPVGLVTISDARTFASMINSVYELRAWLAPTQVALTRMHFSEDLKLTDERSRRRLDRLVEELLTFARRK